MLLPVLLGLLVLIPPATRAQAPVGAGPGATRARVSGEVWVGERGVRWSVAALMAQRQPGDTRVRMYGRPYLRARKAKRTRANKTLATPAASSLEKLAAAGDEAADAPQTVSLSFVGATYADTPAFTPPDPMGDVGPTQFLVAVNGRIRSFRKETGLPDGALNINLDSFFRPVDDGGGVSDPRVRYDRLSGRWFVLGITVLTATNNYVVMAVSDGPVLSSVSSFTFFRFRQDQVAPTGNISQFADYPTLGIDNNALYIGANMFSAQGDYTGTSGWVVRKASVLGAGPIVAKAFRNLATATYSGGTATYGPGPYTPQGVDNDDPNATAGYFVGVDNAEFGKLVLRRILDPGGTPTISGNITLAVPETTYPPSVRPLGSDCPLDTIDDRLLAARIHHNILTGERTLWTAHVIEVNASGVGVDGGGRAATRWYEVKDLATTPALKQSGTLHDPSITNPSHYFNGSVAMSGQGHMALGCSYAGNTAYAGIAVAGRLASDPLGQLRTPTLAAPGLYAYNLQPCFGGSSVQRWGDYSITSVDPEDAMTMWTVQEYVHALDTWGVRVLRLQAPPPATPTAVSVASLAPDAEHVSLTVTGISVNGSGFFDPGAGYPKRLAASLGEGVTVNSVAFVSPTEIRLDVSVASNALSGERVLTIINPDGQAMTAEGLVVVVGAPYTLAEAASALSMAAGLAGPTPDQAGRLNAERSGASTAIVNLADALRIARKATGLDINP